MAFLIANSPGLELNDIGFLSSSDEVIQILWMGYHFNEPFGIFRNASLNLNQWSGWDFGGNHQILGVNLNGRAEFKNLWHSHFYVDTETETHSNSALRGGPTLILPGAISASLSISTSSRKKLEGEIDMDYTLGHDDSGERYGIELGLKYRPISNLNLAIYPEFLHGRSELQYIEQQHFDPDARYILGAIDQKTLSMSLRLDLVLTPELTIQFWGQPFIATGDYFDFKYITDPKAGQFSERFQNYSPDEISYDETGNRYLIHEKGSEMAYEFANPDFNIKEFLSNLVFRWEYRPGSFIYLVWSQSRSGSDTYGQFHLGEDFTDIWDIHPRDVILLKISYRIGR